MLIDGRSLTFEKFEANVLAGLTAQERIHRSHTVPPAPWPSLVIVRTKSAPITKIKVSRWLFAELRLRLPERQTVNYCDGVGPRPVWFHIIVDIDPALTGQQAQLS